MHLDAVCLYYFILFFNSNYTYIYMIATWQTRRAVSHIKRRLAFSSAAAAAQLSDNAHYALLQKSRELFLSRVYTVCICDVSVRGEIVASDTGKYIISCCVLRT